jgi:hypothetical protein
MEACVDCQRGAQDSYHNYLREAKKYWETKITSERIQQILYDCQKMIIRCKGKTATSETVEELNDLSRNEKVFLSQKQNSLLDEDYQRQVSLDAGSEYNLMEERKIKCQVLMASQRLCSQVVSSSTQDIK